MLVARALSRHVCKWSCVSRPFRGDRLGVCAGSLGEGWVPGGPASVEIVRWAVEAGSGFHFLWYFETLQVKPTVVVVVLTRYIAPQPAQRKRT